MCRILVFACAQLFVGHGDIAGSEIDRTVQDLANAAAAADRLVVDLHVRVQLVVFAEPLGIHGVREGGARSIQCGLPHDRQRQRETCQQQCDAIYH